MTCLPRAGLVLAIVGLSGCVELPEMTSPVPAVVDDTRGASDTLAWFDRVAGLPVDEQRREFTAVQSAFEKTASDSNRLRLALALSLPQAPWRDDARVISLLAEWATDTKPTLTRQVAQLLYRLTVERQRLLKDEQRRSEGLQQGEQKRTEALLHDERRKVEELQQKLDALREIDRNTLKAPRR